MNAQDALSHYFVEHGLFPEGSGVEDWLGERWYRIGGLPVLPLVGKIKESLILHDLHHVVTGYETSWTGELELAGWGARQRRLLQPLLLLARSPGRLCDRAARRAAPRVAGAWLGAACKEPLPTGRLPRSR